MPIVGAIGAVTAARRNQARRKANSLVSDSYAVKQRAAREVARRQENTRVQKADDSCETTSTGSKQSMLSMFKQQVQETGGYLKQKQQALSQKVQKLKSGMKYENLGISVKVSRTAGSAKAATVVGAQRLGSECDTAWVQSLEQMGFEASMIEEAIHKVGGKPKNIEDILQMLLTMASSETEPCEDTGPATDLDEEEMQDLLHGAMSPRSAEEASSPLVTTECMVEPSDRELAQFLVGSAISKAARQESSRGECLTQPKHLDDAPHAVSPVRGGA